MERHYVVTIRLDAAVPFALIIILLAATVEPRDIVTAMAEGAHGFLLKDSQPDELLRCVASVRAD